MAGFFGLFNYEKVGPGISKDAPKKRGFIVFFEFFFRNFWKFITINIVHSVISIPVVTSGLANVGITNVARNTARDKHSFGLSDYMDTIKKNWKQGLIAGIINTLIGFILAFDLYFFFNMKSEMMAIIGLGVTFSFIFFFIVMNFYMWTLMITFKYNLKQIYVNSFKFVIINLKKNFLCFFVLAFCYALYISVLLLFRRYFFIMLLAELLIFVCVHPGFRALLIQFCTFPAIKKYIIDPYYEEHPEEDMDKRRDLGLVEEETRTFINEDGEEETENVFEDK